MTIAYAPRPRVLPPAAWMFPRPRTFALANGLRVHAFDLPGKGLVSVALGLGVSAYDDPAGLEGLAALTLSSLSESGGDLDSTDFARALDALGATINGHAGFDGGVVGMSAPAAYLADTLRLAGQAVLAPRFDDDDIALTLAITQDEIHFDKADPSHQAELATAEAYYPATSRRRLPAIGTEETLAAITPQHVRDFYAQSVAPAGAFVALAGDLSGIDIEAVLEEAFGSLPGGPVASRTPTDVVSTGQRRLRVVDHPGAVQSTLVLACPAIGRESPLWPDLLVASHILGGHGLDSLLFKRLRGDLGYTYGASAGVQADQHDARFTVSTAVETGVTAPALRETLALLDRVRTEGFDADIHAQAVNAMTASTVLQFSGARQVLHTAVTYEHLGLPLERFDRTQRGIQDSTAESATRAFREGLDLDHPTLVVVGEADTILPSLRDLGLGEPEVIRS